LDTEIEKQYEHFFSMFVTEGWKQFIEDMEDIYDNYRIEDVKDEKHLNFVKGERAILWRIITLEESLKNAYDSMQAEDA